MRLGQDIGQSFPNEDSSVKKDMGPQHTMGCDNRVLNLGRQRVCVWRKRGWPMGPGGGIYKS